MAKLTITLGKAVNFHVLDVKLKHHDKLHVVTSSDIDPYSMVISCKCHQQKRIDDWLVNTLTITDYVKKVKS